MFQIVNIYNLQNSSVQVPLKGFFSLKKYCDCHCWPSFEDASCLAVSDFNTFDSLTENKYVFNKCYAVYIRADFRGTEL